MRLLIYSLLILNSLTAVATGPSIRFERLTIEDGLSQVSVDSMVHDDKGFLWVATHDGLNRYDGYQFRHFRHDPLDNSSISNNFVTRVFKDSDGTLWVGTRGGGLNRYHPETQRFSHYKHQSDDPDSLSHNWITAIHEDQQGQLWIGTLGGGVNLFDPNSTKFRHFRHIKGHNSLSNDNVRDIISDKNGALWIGTLGGLNRFDSHTSQFVHYRNDPSDPASLSHDSVFSLVEDKKGDLWLGTLGGGLNRFEIEKQRFTVFKHDPNKLNSISSDRIWFITLDKQGNLWVGSEDSGLSYVEISTMAFIHYAAQATERFSLSHNSIRTIYCDTQGLLWVGTLLGGMNKLDTRHSRFGHFKHASDDGNSLNHDAVMSIFEDQSQSLWVGTWNGGLNRQMKNTPDFEHFVHRPGDPSSLSNNSVWSIYQDPAGTLWIGTKGGLNRYNPKDGSFSHFKHDKSDPSSLSHDWVTSIIEDRQGQLWIGTRGGGLNRLNRQTMRFTHFRAQTEQAGSLSSDFVFDIINGDDGTLWIATWGGGLNHFNQKNHHFAVYRNDKSNPNSLSDDYVMALHNDSFGNIWLGTFGGGLNKFTPKTAKFHHFREQDGLPNDIVYGVLEDRQNKLWLSTNRGIARFDVTQGIFKTYDVNDGLQSNEFNGGAYFSSPTGELFFGGVNGFNRFYPHHIKDDTAPPAVVFTDFLLFNQSVPIKRQSIPGVFTLTQAIDQQPLIELNYHQSLVTFEFAALNYRHPLNNQYRYKLEGLDQQWIKADAKIRRATYTTLAPGHYRLRVMASVSGHDWNEHGAGIAIYVAPPPWRTWWAYTLYLLAFSLLVVSFIYYKIARNKMHNERIMLHHLKQVDRLKDDFLANTSHELRTPLNGIIGLAESLIDGIDGKLPVQACKTLSMVVLSGRRLASLINDILDLSKLRHTSIALQRHPVDLHALTDVVLALSRPLIGDKKLTLHNEVPKDIAPVIGDENRLLQILHNLVGNGIKFTPSGSVTVGADSDVGVVSVSVSDTGIGIKADKFETIFDSFEQLQANLERVSGGTGLGLSISKQLVDLHGGSIKVSSVIDQGSTFTFTLPACEDLASRAVDDKAGVIEAAIIDQLSQDNQYNVSLDDLGPDNDVVVFKILLVDDEPINIHVLKNYLSSRNYQLVEAQDGEQALALIAQEGPFDLVLLDIMMPKMSGYEVCRIIRQQYSVSDLPVLFLTASMQIEDVVEGFRVGGNDHLHKPVAKHELLSRVNTHLRLLDINRNLEQRVNERTAKIEQQKQRLQLNNAKILAAQEKLILSEKLALLGTLMAGVAHEINNPIHFVNLSVGSLTQEINNCYQFIIDLAGSEPPAEIIDALNRYFKPMLEHTEVIKDGTERLITIVKDLKHSTHMDASEKVNIDISSMLTSTLNLVGAKYKEQVAFVTNMTPLPEMFCYPSKLNQVFMNLIVNGCDALCEAPSKSGKGVIAVSCKTEGNFIEITVEDNGCGMSQAVKSKIFEPFYTTKCMDTGTGLGLAISYDIVQKHGGELLVESTEGVGSTFKVLLPISL